MSNRQKRTRYLDGLSAWRYRVGRRLRWHGARTRAEPAAAADEVRAISQRKHGRRSPWQQMPRRPTAASAAEAEASSKHRARRRPA